MDADRFLEQMAAAPARLQALYCIAGDEALLVIEVQDALRQAARQAGYTDRTVLTLDARSDWSSALASTQAVSLFGDRQLIELRLPSGKPGKPGADALQQLAAQQARDSAQGTPEAIVMISLPRLDKTTRTSKWFSALEQSACLIEIASVDRARLPAWIGMRLARQGQKLDRDSLQWMADKVEGNLLAAHQEIQKLGLLYPEGDLAAEDVHNAVLNVARYNVFSLRDAMLAGQAERTLRLLDGLRAEGEALPLVLWAVGDEIRQLARLAAARQSGQDMGALMRRLRFFGDHERLARQALDRVPARIWPAAVRHAHDVDRLIKGLAAEGRMADPWEEMARLALRIARPS